MGGGVFIQIDADILEGKPKSEWKSAVRQEIQRIFDQGLKLTRGGVFSNRKGRGEYSNGSYTRMLERTDPQMYEDKMRMAAGSDGIVKHADDVTYEDASHERADDILGFNRGKITVSVKGSGYSGDVLTAIYSDGKETFFDVNNLSRKNIEAVPPERYAAQGGFTQAGDTASDTQSIPQTVEGVKGQDMQRGVGVYAPPGESIDSSIERMYNETEPDHFEITETPGELPVIDEDYFTQWEATPHGGEEAGAADGGAVYGADVRGETGETGVYPGRTGAISEAANGLRSGESRTEGGREIQRWAKGYVIQQPDGAGLRQALEKMKAYTPDVVVVADSTLKGRNSSALAVTSDGVIYLSDAIPDNLSQVVPFHEVVHVAKQNGNRAYMAFLNTLGEKINIAKTPSRVLNIVIESRYPGKTLFDLSSAQLDTVYDELNALVWGYHKADAANARAQFAEMFIDYDAYISELDAIMEASRKNVLEVPENVDGLIEQAYNETEPDHSEVFEVPERILPRERELIDEEWSGGASDFGAAPVPVKEDATFETKIPAYAPPVNQSISKAARHTVLKGAEHRGEHLVLVDSVTGEWVFEEAGDDRSVGNSGVFREFVRQHPQGRYTYVHSHPSGDGFSLNDMAEFFGGDQFDSMVAAGYNGRVYTVYGKRARVSVWNEVMKPEVDGPLLQDLREPYEAHKIDSFAFGKEAERRRVQYLIEHFCSVMEVKT